MTQNMTIKMMKMWNLQLRVASACSAFDDCLECRSRNPDPCRYTPIQGLTAHALGSLWLHSRHVIDSLLQNMLPTTVHNQKDPPLCSSKGIHCVPFLQSVSSSSGMDPNRFEPACAHVAAIAISCHIQEAPYERMENHNPMAIDGLWLVSQEQPRLGVHGRFGIRLESNRRVHSTPAQLRKALEQNDATWCKDMQKKNTKCLAKFWAVNYSISYIMLYILVLYDMMHIIEKPWETVRHYAAIFCTCKTSHDLQNLHPFCTEVCTDSPEHKDLRNACGPCRCQEISLAEWQASGWNLGGVWRVCFCFRCAKYWKNHQGHLEEPGTTVTEPGR